MKTSCADSAARTCPFCAEPIRAAAKVCPRCRQWLSFRSLRNPVVGGFLVAGAMMALWLVLGVALEKNLNRLSSQPPYYEEFPNALQVLQSRMNWVATKDGLRIFVTGMLTNRSAIAWQGLEFECRFFDAGGKLVDAANARGGYLTVRGNDDSAFRIAVVPAGSSNDYQSFQIKVSTARNTKSSF
jgi:hypothetical protein